MVGQDASDSRRRGRSKATIKDVAARAGVGWMTVSRALRDPAAVSPATRARVEAAIAECGYIPNRLARGLRNLRSHIVVVIVPSISNPVFTEVARGVADVLTPHGFEVLFGNTDYDLDVEERRIRTFLQWGPEAVIVAGTTHAEGTVQLLRQMPIPVVEMMETAADPIDLNVGLSHFDVGRDMTRYLCGRGYRRIGYVSARIAQDHRALRRREGFRAALAEHGWQPALEDDLGEAASYGVGARHARAFAQRGLPADALYFANDVLAVGALLEFQRLGVSVPAQVAVAGFNGLDISEHVNPPLTTTLTPRYEIGRIAARMVLDRCAGVSETASRIELAATILRRESA